MQTLEASPLPEPWMSPRAALTFAWAQLDHSSRVKLLLATAVLAVLSLADLLGLLVMATLMIMVLGVLADSSTLQPPDWIPISDLKPSVAIPLLGCLGVALIVAKTLVSWRLTRRVYLFTARREPQIANRVYATYLSAPFAASQNLSLMQVGAAINAGAPSLMATVDAATVMIADAVLLGLLAGLLLFSDPLLLAAAVVYFGLVAFGVTRIIGQRSARYGREAFEANMAAGETANASIGFAPEIRLYGIADQFGERLYIDQLRASLANAQQQVIFQAPRFVYEVGVIVGFVLVSSAAFLLQEPAEAAFTVALFMLTSARMVPALQRLGANWGRLKLSTEQTASLAPILRLPPPEISSTSNDSQLGSPLSGKGWALVLKDVGYQYPGTDEPALTGVSMSICRGSRVALVGHTGSGKSTLANLIAGLAQATTGAIERHESADWRKRIAVVPQDVYLAPDSIRNNVALPVLGNAEDDGRIWRALAMAQVDHVVAALPDGLDTELGERGARISGGEAQRLGLARALYRQPSLLVLDEATSSLDAATEESVSAAIRAMSEDCTVVLVAHRLATVRDADLVVLLESGSVVAQGTFDEVVRASSAFAEAASLQGLTAVDVIPHVLDGKADSPKIYP